MFYPTLILKYRRAKKVLEIGCGAGALAAWMVAQGFEVRCLEPAKRPAAKAAAKKLRVDITTIQNFNTDEKFDMVIAISSLIHVPKDEMQAQMEKIGRFLKPGGVFVATFLSGKGEGFEDPTNEGKKRFFSRWSEDELDPLMEPHFRLLESYRLPSKSMKETFLLRVYAIS